MGELVNDNLMRSVEAKPILKKSRTSPLGKPISATFLKVSLFLFLLICGLAVFVLGTSYYDQFPTNTSGLFKIGLSALYLLTAILTRKIVLLRPYWRVM